MLEQNYLFVFSILFCNTWSISMRWEVHHIWQSATNNSSLYIYITFIDNFTFYFLNNNFKLTKYFLPEYKLIFSYKKSFSFYVPYSTLSECHQGHKEQFCSFVKQSTKTIYNELPRMSIIVERWKCQTFL